MTEMHATHSPAGVETTNAWPAPSSHEKEQSNKTAPQIPSTMTVGLGLLGHIMHDMNPQKTQYELCKMCQMCSIGSPWLHFGSLWLPFWLAFGALSVALEFLTFAISWRHF